VAAPAPTELLPLELADLHRSLPVGARVGLPVADVAPERWADIVEGAGFRLDRGRAVRRRTLPDYVGPGMRLLVVGLNPSLYAADAGVGFARPGNRFWPALHRSGFTATQLHPEQQDELVALGLGVTNVAARATARADDLTAAELVAGGRTLRRKVARYRPRWVAVLGIGAYRTAFGAPDAVIGEQPVRLAGARVWVLPNPSGLNAHYPLPRLSAEFAALREATGR
jgi:TDG/mug DNA glycosylase family protein